MESYHHYDIIILLCKLLSESLTSVGGGGGLTFLLDVWAGVSATFVFFFLFDSMFISVEDRTRGIRFSYNSSMSFTYCQLVITKQSGDTLYTRSYNLKDQNMYDHRSKHVWLKHQYNVKRVHLIVLKTMKGYKRVLEGGTV